MTDREWTYPLDLAGALTRFGLAPTSRTPPRLVRSALNALYRYELRRLRDRLLGGEIPKPEYIDRVVGLRRRYWPLSMLPEVWERVCGGSR